MNTTDKNRIIADWLAGHGYGNIAWSLQRLVAHPIPHDFTKLEYILPAVKAWCWYQNTSNGFRGSDKFGYRLFWFDGSTTVMAVIAPDWHDDGLYYVSENADTEGVALRDTLVSAIEAGDPKVIRYSPPEPSPSTGIIDGSFS